MSPGTVSKLNKRIYSHIEKWRTRFIEGSYAYLYLDISDACLGLVESIGEFYPEARWQRCTVHFYRNVFSHVPRGKVTEVSRMLKAIHASVAKEKAQAVVKKIRGMKLKSAADLVEKVVEQTLTYYHFPSEHWLRIRTNNPMERIIREIRRRTWVVGAFPDGESSLMLVAGRLRHVASIKWGNRKYLNMQLLKHREYREALAG